MFLSLLILKCLLQCYVVRCRLFEIKLKLTSLPLRVLVYKLLHSYFHITSLLRSFFSRKYLCPTTTLPNKIMLIKSYCSQVMSDLCYLLQKRTIAQAIVTGVMQRLLVRIPMSSHIGTCKAGFLENGKKGFL